MIINPTNIIKYTNEVNDNLKDERNKYLSAYKHLNVFNRAKLERIDRLEFELIKKIENDSFWQYTGDSFKFLNNFHYNYDTNQITYTVNKVVSGSDSFISSNDSNIEKDFIKSKI